MRKWLLTVQEQVLCSELEQQIHKEQRKNLKTCHK